MTSSVKQLCTALLDFILPPLCHICHSFIPDAGKLHICPTCRERLPLVLSPICTLCGIPFSSAGGDHRCGACINNPPHFDVARAPFLYEGAIRELIHSFKYDRRTHLRYPLAILAMESAQAFMTYSPQLVIPVPLHKSRLRQRGFNQAVLFGKMLSQGLSLPMVPDALTRIRPTEPQINLNAADRHLNVRGAFAVKRPAAVAGKQVLLLDDVMTTGSTMDECAKELKRAGAVAVVAATIARTAR